MIQKSESRKILGLAISGVVIAGTALAFAGPLDPPAGPVVSTSPSLAEIAALIQSQSGSSTDGPWMVEVIDSRDGLGSQNTSIQIAGGQPVILHSINAFRVSSYAFNGPGVLSGGGTITSGDVVGQVTQAVSKGVVQDTRVQTSNQAVLDVLCPDGLEIAWTYNDTAAYFIHVYYKIVN